MIFTSKHTNSHFFDTSLKILTPALLVVLVTNMRYECDSTIMQNLALAEKTSEMKDNNMKCNTRFYFFTCFTNIKVRLTHLVIKPLSYRCH